MLKQMSWKRKGCGAHYRTHQELLRAVLRFARVSQKIVASAILCAGGLPAADNGGSIQGVVKNASGEPVSGAFVKLKNPDRRLTFMVISQAQGRYTANNLPAGKNSVQRVGGYFQSEIST